MISKPHSALVIVGHGSTVNPDSSTPTYAHADEIKRRGVFDEVVCAFWKEEPSLRQVRYMVESDDVYVVPNFISEGYFTQKVIPRELGVTGPVTRIPAGKPQSTQRTQRNAENLGDLCGSKTRTIKYCEPVGNHPRMTELLLRRAREVAPNVRPDE